LYERGPTGFVILDVDGRPEFDAIIMAEGFALNGVVMALFAILLHVCRTATPNYGDRLKLVSLVATLAGPRIYAFFRIGMLERPLTNSVLYCSSSS
jgi:hypothetical protein